MRVLLHGSWELAVFFFAGFSVGLPLVFFLPLTPYFEVGDWIETLCTCSSSPISLQYCGKDGCKFVGQVSINYTTISGTPVVATLYSSPGGVANLDSFQVNAWMQTHMASNKTTCYYNPDNIQDVTDEKIVAWYLYLYAIIVTLFMLCGLYCCCFGVISVTNVVVKVTRINEFFSVDTLMEQRAKIVVASSAVESTSQNSTTTYVPPSAISPHRNTISGMNSQTTTTSSDANVSLDEEDTDGETSSDDL